MLNCDVICLVGLILFLLIAVVSPLILVMVMISAVAAIVL